MNIHIDWFDTHSGRRTWQQDDRGARAANRSGNNRRTENWSVRSFCALENLTYYAPPRDLKGRGVAPIGATRGVH